MLTGMEPTERTRVHRLPERGVYDRETIDAILDEALICHIAFTDGDGSPRCLPTIHARLGDTIYLHGSRGARAWKAIRAAEICLVATIVDGLVMARSAFPHSMNYRSVVMYGKAREVVDPRRASSRCAGDHLACRPRSRGRGPHADPR
jgi:nitroimidazol reductase NimA-like FMN-containing flavoprotein (pyridoxamine 5'-phosphate oxidase superfamily)